MPVLKRLPIALLMLALALGGSWPTRAGSADLPPWEPTTPALAGEALQRLEAALAALAPQRPGHSDLYVLGVAGDVDEAVFGNEVLYLQQLFGQRFATAGRSLGLINPAAAHADGSTLAATYDSLGYSLDRLGRMLDPDEDVLLLYLSSHGLEDGSFYLHTGPDQEDYLSPEDLAQLLDEAGIGNAVIVVSACYSGAFVPVLKAPNRMIITAARHDRPSFGCGNSDSATWFGRAFLVEALNRTADFAEAFQQARATVRVREREQHERPSQPQISVGKKIGEVLARWRNAIEPGAALPYPFVHPPATPTPANEEIGADAGR